MLVRATSTLVLLGALSVSAQDVHVRVSPDVKTGIEGTTEFPTIQNALDHHPFAGPAPGRDGRPARVFLEIAPGTYHERIIVTQNHPSVTLLGTGPHPEDTVITNSLNARDAGGTFFTETAEINATDFEASNLTFENSAGNANPSAGQAVAVAVRADRAVFKHVRFLGHQDTLFADFGRQYYLDCFITGGVDFLFGNATAVFDRSELNSNAPGFLTAQSRTSSTQTTGFVILRSRVRSSIPHIADTPPGPGAIHLGRPWRPYARVVFLETELPAELDAAGWNNWGKSSNEATAFFGEYGSTGLGANPAARAKWSHQLTDAERQSYLPQTFLRGADGWNAEEEAAHLP